MDPVYRRAAVVATAITVPAVVIVALLIGRSDTPSKPAPPSGGALPAITVAAPPVSAAASAPCTALIGALPNALDGLVVRPARSASSFVAAWGDPAVVLRCGVGRPPGLVADSAAFLPGINGVFYWLEPGKTADIYTAIDRAAYVEVTVPHRYAAGPMSPISTAITKSLPAVCAVDPQAPVASLCTHRS